MNLLPLDATDTLQSLEAGRVGALDLLDEAVARSDRFAALNAVVARDIDRARAEARRVDDARAAARRSGGAGNLGPLAGLPMTVKDTFDVEGLPASSGLARYLGRSCQDAEAVHRARLAGAVVWGKTNVPVLAGDFQTFNPLYGRTNNPWDLARTCGGSSGGAAAALASGVTALEIGSDIGGSLRTPAGFCGVLSLKPSWGRVPQLGHVPPQPGAAAERDLNVVGPIARSVRDLGLLFAVLAGNPVGAAVTPVEPRSLRLALWTEASPLHLDPEVRTAVEDLGRRAAQAGAEVEPIPAPTGMTQLLDVYGVLLLSILAQDMPASRVRLARLARGPARLARRLGAGPTSAAAQILGLSATHSEWLAADELRARMRREVGALFSRFDAIVAPVNPVCAFPHDERPFDRRRLTLSTGQSAPYTAMLEWVALASALGLPVVTLPAGRTPAGLPVGVQLIGPYGGDERLLAVAAALEQAADARYRPPPGQDAR